MKIFFFILFFSTSAFAIEAVINVLEAPLFKSPDSSSEVVQHFRKGETVELSDEINPETKFNHLAPENYQEKESDHPQFVKTKDRMGREAYLLRDHVFIYFEDERENEQAFSPKPDMTDYRLTEPLPERYPLRRQGGQRGQILAGRSQPYLENYPYNANIKARGYTRPIDFMVVMGKQAPDDTKERFYLGGVVRVKYFTNEFILTNDRTTKETGLKIGLGPYAGYDAFKQEKNRIHLFTAINVHLFDQLQIRQNSTSQSDSRYYRGFSVSPMIGAQYIRNKIMADLDFVLGLNAEMELPHTMNAKTPAQMPEWWLKNRGDKFKTQTVWGLGAMVGLQTTY